MSSFGYLVVPFGRVKRSAALTAVIAGLVFAAPLASASAQTNTPETSAPQTSAPQTSAPQTPAAQTPTRPTPAHQSRAVRRAETIDQRIAALHAELKITPAEETDWNAVAQAMRANAAAMQKLAADKRSQQNMTAVEDLQTYQQFAQTHLDGLKDLIASFQTLYDSMPDQQKKLADQVFQRSRRQTASKPG